MKISIRTGVYIRIWLVGAGALCLGGGMIAAAISAAFRGDPWLFWLMAFGLGTGAMICAIGIVLPYRPGANALFVDRSGLGITSGGSTVQYAWSAIASMVAVDTSYGYRTVRPAGIKMVLRTEPLGATLFISDHYTIRRDGLLELMAKQAGWHGAQSGREIAPTKQVRPARTFTAAYVFAVIPVLLLSFAVLYAGWGPRLTVLSKFGWATVLPASAAGLILVNLWLNRRGRR